MLCQLANQTHAAIVNYTNRNAMADDEGDNHKVKSAFFCAIIASSLVAVGCKCGLRCQGPTLKVNSLQLTSYLFLVYRVILTYFISH